MGPGDLLETRRVVVGLRAETSERIQGLNARSPASLKDTAKPQRRPYQGTFAAAPPVSSNASRDKKPSFGISVRLCTMDCRLRRMPWSIAQLLPRWRNDTAIRFSLDIFRLFRFIITQLGCVEHWEQASWMNFLSINQSNFVSQCSIAEV